MNGELLWDKIVGILTTNPVEVSTVPSNKKEPLWFSAYTDGGKICVENSKVRNPSTKISQARKITRADFLTVYPFYHRWASGERYLRQEVAMLSQNTAYIFGLIAMFE